MSSVSQLFINKTLFTLLLSILWSSVEQEKLRGTHAVEWSLWSSGEVNQWFEIKDCPSAMWDSYGTTIITVEHLCLYYLGQSVCNYASSGLPGIPIAYGHFYGNEVCWEIVSRKTGFCFVLFLPPPTIPKIIGLMWLKLPRTDVKFQACFCLCGSYFSRTIGWQEKSGFIIKRQRGTLSARVLKVRQRLFVKSWRSFHKKGWFIENCCQNSCTSWQQQRQSPPFPNVLLSAS